MPQHHDKLVASNEAVLIPIKCFTTNFPIKKRFSEFLRAFVAHEKSLIFGAGKFERLMERLRREVWVGKLRPDSQLGCRMFYGIFSVNFSFIARATVDISFAVNPRFRPN